jgi:hypothetical protein
VCGFKDGARFGYTNCHLHDNTAVVRHPQGVALYEGDADSSVRHNHVWTLPGAENQTRVNIINDQGTGPAQHCGNTAGPGGAQNKPAWTDGPCEGDCPAPPDTGPEPEVLELHPGQAVTVKAL